MLAVSFLLQGGTLSGLCKPMKLACGQQHTAVVSVTGDVYTWGKSHKGRWAYYYFVGFAFFLPSRSSFDSWLTSNYSILLLLLPLPPPLPLPLPLPLPRFLIFIVTVVVVVVVVVAFVAFVFADLGMATLLKMRGSQFLFELKFYTCTGKYHEE